MWICPKEEVLLNLCVSTLIDWGRVTHICVGNLTIIGSDNCYSPGRRHAIIWTDAGILLFGPSETDFNEILIKKSYIFIQENLFENVDPDSKVHGANMGPTGPRWAPGWSHELCYPCRQEDGSYFVLASMC